MITCSSCGYEMEAGAPICGNCGQPTAGGTAPDRPLAASGGALGGPGGPLAGGRGPLAPLVKPLLALLVLGGVTLALFGPAQDLVREITGIVDEFQGTLEENPALPAPDAAATGEQAAAGYRGVRQIAADLRAGGVACRNVVVDASEDTVESGSCTVDGTHVQMIVYRTQGPLDFAMTEIYGDDWPFAYVHDDNWFVSTTKPLARDIRRALGGTLSAPPGS